MMVVIPWLWPIKPILSDEPVPASQNSADLRPNVILLMADDHGWGDTGYHGHPFVQTPHLDGMAEDGIQFARWYAAAPVCSPTRGSCLTGRHPDRYGIYFANTGRLEPEEICLAEELREEGYATGHFGKWHLGTLTTTVKDANRGGPGSEAVYSPPWENGFETCFSTESKVPTFNPMTKPAPVSRESKGGPGGSYGTWYWTEPGERVPPDELTGDDSALIMDRALDFMEESKTAQRPFLAVIWFHAPHTPVVADASHRDLYPNHPFGLYGRHYHGCISAMDDQIGRLRAWLEEQGIEKNTMLWYSADNGPESTAKTGAGTAGPLRGRKRSLYEGGIRVPGLLVWPAQVPQARTVTAPCVSSDYFPTILDAIGRELPERAYDGISLLPLITAQTETRPKPIGFQSRKQIAWLDGIWKLYSSDSGRSWELYNLDDDPGEKNNVAEKHAARVNTMSTAAAAWSAGLQLRR